MVKAKRGSLTVNDLDLIVSRIESGVLEKTKKGISDSAILANLEEWVIVSVLADWVAWGAEVTFDAPSSTFRLNTIVHDVDTPKTRKTIQSALVRAKGNPTTATAIAQNVPLNPAADLVAAPPTLRADVAAKRDFGLLIEQWSMPYLSREGRTLRLCAYSPTGKVIALLEVGDDAPVSKHRDILLGLHPDSLINGRTRDLFMSRRDEIITRIRAIRHCIKGTPGGVSPTDDTNLPEHLTKVQKALTLQTEKVAKKRLKYFADLLEAEIALSASIGTEQFWLGAKKTLTLIRNLTLGRVHTELTICGAVSPFNKYRVGKLIVALAGHPEVRNITKREPGAILASTFDTAALVGLLPDTGVLCITTKGLYPKHSPQYHKARIPGATEDLLMRKLGDTDGTGTSSHLSNATIKTINRYLQAAGADIDRVYGSGGSKKMRAVKKALSHLGMDAKLGEAGVTRPVYGTLFVSNIEEVLLLNSQPVWALAETQDSRHYEQLAHSLWLSMPGVQEALQT